MTMKRRTFLTASAAALALPSAARAQAQTTLRFIPQIDLVFLDPHWTTAYVTRNHSYMVFDTLYGQDGTYKVSPQMVEGHTIENDGKLWRLKLRDGLLWHDGDKVLARDCVASIKRWGKRDSLGDALMAATDELSAPDDRTIQFRLKKPFALLADALGKSPSPMCAMLPERIANTDPFKQITEMIGSGPFKYEAKEYRRIALRIRLTVVKKACPARIGSILPLCVSNAPGRSCWIGSLPASKTWKTQGVGTPACTISTPC
jgi:peptide/nickel transport system substrate-binding protein